MTRVPHGMTGAYAAGKPTRRTWLALLAAGCLLAGVGFGVAESTSTAAAKSTAPVATASSTTKLVLDNESGSTWTCQFNPFNPAVLGTSFGYTYEPLEFVDILKNSAVTPWLAISSTWSNDYRTLTFAIRAGVKWNDGKPFSANDVVYTFNAMTKDKALDLNALWKADGGSLTSVKLSGANDVVFTFDAPSQTYFYYVADQTPIIPEHIFGAMNQTKLSSFADTNPVGTGPYRVGTCSGQNIQYLRNTTYWQSTPKHQVPAIDEVDYPAFLSNTPANLFLAQGQAQWGSQYIPNISSFYIAPNSKDRHYWFAPILNVSLFPNLSNSLLSNLAVRKAIELAISRPNVAARGETGYEQPADQAGVVLPTYKAWYDASLMTPAYNPTAAEQVLKAAGFTKGSNGIDRNSKGQSLSFTIITISGFSDWDASLTIIQQELKAVGIGVTVEDENSGPYTTDLEQGKFQLAYAGSGGPYPTPGPSPYYELRSLLLSSDIGGTNYSRFNSPSTDALFNAFPGSTPAQQLQIMDKVEQVMVNQIPFIPITEGVDWDQYDTTNIGGWPTAANPYAQGAIYQTPDVGVVLDHLYSLG